MQRKHSTLLACLAVGVIVLVSGCQQEQSTGSVQLVGSLHQSLASGDIHRVVVTVTAPGLTPRTAELPKEGEVWRGFLGLLPAGPACTFTAEAFGADGTKLFAGSSTGVTLNPKVTTVVYITLQELAPPPSFDNAVPIIDAFMSSASSVAPGDSVTLNVSAHDPNPTDTLTYAWTSTAGSFSSVSGSTTVWTAPMTPGAATITLTVSDSHGSPVLFNLTLAVRGDRGDADVIVSLNLSPRVTRVTANPAWLRVGETTAVVATAEDPDGDPLTYEWSATGCSGFWEDTTARTTHFTPDAPPPGGVCSCRLNARVRDGRGGQAQGSLSICVGPPTTPSLPPEVVGTFQSSTSAANSPITLRVEAVDPQGSPLGFSWTASAGTLGTPTTSASQSEVVWTTPECLPGSGGQVSITATVSNALGLTAPALFTVQGVPGCLPHDSLSAVNGMHIYREFHTATMLPSGEVLVVGGNTRAMLSGFFLEHYNPWTGLSRSTASISISSSVYHTTTLLTSGKVLIVGGSNPSTPSAELYDPTTETLTTAGSPSMHRSSHTATLLSSGKVLVASGYGPSSITATAEVYDPATGAWTPTGSLNTSRALASATLLPSGQVLLTGGYSASGSPLASAEVYDPATGVWTPIGSMTQPRTIHTATLLPSGKVLVAGGNSSKSPEVYDPATGEWTPTPSTLAYLSGHTATLLPSGKVLVVGNSFQPEVYDPVTGGWAPAGSIIGTRYSHTATLLPSGKVLLLGGGTSYSSAEVYDPATGTSDLPTRPNRLYPFHEVELSSGKVLSVGSNPSSAHLYDPVTRIWNATTAPAMDHLDSVSIRLLSGKVLVAGGMFSGAEVYDPVSTSWTPTGAPAEPHIGATVTLLPSGKVLVAGGQLATGASTATAELYDPVTGVWTKTGSMTESRTRHTATLLPSGRVLVTGSFTATAELYDPVTETWTPTNSMRGIRYHHTATLLPSGKVLVVGGEKAVAGVELVAELYDPVAGTWAPTGALHDYRGGHTATLLSSGKVLVMGGSTLMAEIYDPTTGTWTVSKSLGPLMMQHTATRLASGQVLLVGGFDFMTTSTTMLYNP